MASIRWENLTKDFGEVVAVNEMDLECEDGEFLSLLGPSGCGKTTTLRMTAGLETPTSGHIYFDEEPITDLSPRDRNIAMVFENYALYPHKTVYKNISYPLELRGMSKSQIDEKVKYAAELLDIDMLLDRYPKEVSGGQKQRVGTARALVREPTAFLMDEPLSHLDAKLRANLRADLKRLQKDLDITTVFVTHDQLEAMTMADRVAVMNFGVIQQHGTPMELFRDPANLFVAKFIGEPSMNVLSCEMKDEDGQSYLVGEGLQLRLAPAMRKAIEEKSTSPEVLLGVRPQHIDICLPGEAEANGHNLVSCTVYVSEPLGAEQLVRVRIGPELVKVLTGDDVSVDIDEEITVNIPEDRIFLFDSKTEDRIY